MKSSNPNFLKRTDSFFQRFRLESYFNYIAIQSNIDKYLPEICTQFDFSWG